MFHLGKDVENRTWEASYRGPLLICASLKVEIEECRKLRLDPASLPTGCIVGVVELKDCTRNVKSKWAERGRFHFVLCDPQTFKKPIPHHGQLRLFDVPLSTLLL
jgi:ASCH domain